MLAMLPILRAQRSTDRSARPPATSSCCVFTRGVREDTQCRPHFRGFARKMRIAHFSTDGPTGGAGRAAYTLHKSLGAAACESMLVLSNPAGAEGDVIDARGHGVAAGVRNRIIQRR